MNVLDTVYTYLKRTRFNKYLIGKSFFGEPLYAFSVKKTATPKIIVVGGVHAREYITSYLTLYLAEDFSHRGKRGTAFFVPLLNPDGVKRVLSGDNLIGVVREVSLNSATVYTVFHPDVSVSAYETRTREDCYTEAQNSFSLEGTLKLMGLARTTPVVAGGIVCTSCIGGIYPRDLIIGTVTQVVNSESDISAYAVIKPAVDPRTAVDVFVITDFEDKAR